eukprot:461728_1
MACCGGNKDDTEHEDVVQDLEAGVGKYEQSVGKSLLTSFRNRAVFGVLGLLVGVAVTTVVYHCLHSSFDTRAKSLVLAELDKVYDSFASRSKSLVAELGKVKNKEDTERFHMLVQEVEKLNDAVVAAGKFGIPMKNALESQLWERCTAVNSTPARSGIPLSDFVCKCGKVMPGIRPSGFVCECG